MRRNTTFRQHHTGDPPKPRDAVIEVTRCAIDHLNREQLQGVIAHEFSHIFNDDMRLNLRLMGVLNGILILGILGNYLLYSASFSRGRRGNNQGAAAMLELLIGLIAAVKADILSLTAWQVGSYGFTAVAIFWIFAHLLHAKLQPNTVEFWFMMQIAMLFGFATSYPVNWWLIRIGVTEKM